MALMSSFVSWFLRVMPPSGTRTSEYEPQRSRPSLGSPSANCTRPVRDTETSPNTTGDSIMGMPKPPVSVVGKKPQIDLEHFYYCRLGRRTARGSWGALRVQEVLSTPESPGTSPPSARHGPHPLVTPRATNGPFFFLSNPI